MILKSSPDWPGAKAWLQLEIARAGAALESDVTGIKESDLLRGEIRMMRKIIAFVEPPAKVELVDHPSPEGSSY